MKTTVVVKERVVVVIVAAREARVDRMMGVRGVEKARVAVKEERARVVLMMVILEEEEENLAITVLVKDLIMVTLVVANPDLMMDILEVATEEVGTLMMEAMEAGS